MKPSLDGPRLKIKGAMKKIEHLRAADERFRNATDYRVITAELESKGREYALRVLVDVLPPLELGVCIGEIAHDLRSALDNLAWQLALTKTQPPAGNTQFPIFLIGRTTRRRKPRKGKGRGQLISHFMTDGLGMIRSLHREHQAAIEQLQPYKSGNGGKDNSLYLLSEINNADKHRLIQVAGGKPMGYSVGAVWGDGPMPVYHINIAVLEDGAKVGSTAASDVAARNVRENQEILPYIGFWKGCPAVEGRGICITLSQIADHVSQIVESFGPEVG